MKPSSSEKNGFLEVTVVDVTVLKHIDCSGWAPVFA